MKPTVLLFDIDGTLVTTGGAGRRAIVRTFAEVYQRPDACEHFHFGGMTDWAIMRAGLAAIGEDVTEGPAATAAIASLLARYVLLLGEEVDRATPEHYRVHRGMQAAIDAGRAAGMAVGLGTGNIEAGARVKLRRVQLEHHFDFGGFGDDSELRPELLRRGAERGAARLGVAREHARVVVIGDTPKDVAAAQAIGAECVAVATGGCSREALEACRPTRVFADLAAPGALQFVLGY
jgi:phosphoglycolate phosphatase